MKSLNKKNILLFLGIFIFSMITYIFFITGFQSIDTYKIVTLGLDEYAKSYSLSDGRIFMGILNLIADSVNINLKLKNEYFKNDEESMKIIDNVIYIQTK